MSRHVQLALSKAIIFLVAIVFIAQMGTAQAANGAGSKTSAASKNAAAQKAAAAVRDNASDADKAEQNVDKSLAKLTSPTMTWAMKSQKDALSDEVTTNPSSLKYVAGANGKLQGFVTTTAYCSSNGVSIFFLASAGSNDPVPTFSWYTDDSSRDGEQIADVRLRVDERSVHVAQGFPNKDGHNLYTNTLGLLFYEPHTYERSVRDQQNNVNTGIPALDGMLGGVVKQAAQANARNWQDSSAGPLSDLINARRIRVELPVPTFDPKPVLDLNPQDPVLHKFVSECNAKFGR
jgi:hypothetical protein